jgi:hypothetical protein
MLVFSSVLWVLSMVALVVAHALSFNIDWIVPPLLAGSVLALVFAFALIICAVYGRAQRH